MPGVVKLFNGLWLLINGDLANADGCCCDSCGRCYIGEDQIDCLITDEATCEECVTTHQCFDEATSELTAVASCEECVGEGLTCFSNTTGRCGSWQVITPCDPCPCGTSVDCPPGKACCESGCVPAVCDQSVCLTFHFTNTCDELDFDYVVTTTGDACGPAERDYFVGTNNALAPYCVLSFTIGADCAISGVAYNGGANLPYCDGCTQYNSYTVDEC